MSNCWTGCLDRRLCKSEDKGLFVEARYLQMTDLEIPYEIEQRNLRTLLLTEETAKETFTQQAAIIEKETEQIVRNCIISFDKCSLFSLPVLTSPLQDNLGHRACQVT